VSLPKKRLKSLDALRGIAILAMLPFHMLTYGGYVEVDGGGTEQAITLLVEFDPPLATGLILFFFLTGMSLAVSFSKRREQQSPFVMWRRVLLRYGGYILGGIISEFILLSIFFQIPITVENLTMIASGQTFSGPIIGLGLAAILTFPLIQGFSGKKLLVVSLIGGALLSGLLYFFLVPQSSLSFSSEMNLLLTGWFGVLKGVPMVLAGGAIGKLIGEGKWFQKYIFPIGSVIGVAYIIIPTLLGSGMLHILFAVWAYPHAVLFTVGISICLFGILHRFEARNFRISTAFSVLGRSSFYVFYGHWFILGVLLIWIGSQVNVLFLTLLATATIWIITYVYSRKRWGNPSTW
jgi:uncharacterized membrane protein